MTLAADAAANRAALVAQLYDDWHGCYVVQRLVNGAYVDVRQLSREEAMMYRLRNDETLKLVYPQ